MKPVVQTFGKVRGPILATLVFLGCWGFVILAFATQLVLRASFEWAPALRTSANDWLPWVILSPAVWWLARRFPLERGKLLVHIPVQLLSCVVAVTLCGWIANLTTESIIGAGPPRGALGARLRGDSGPGGNGPSPTRAANGPSDAPVTDEGREPPPRLRREGRGGNSPGGRPDRGPPGGPRRFWEAVIINRSRINLPVFWVIVSVAHAFSFYRRVEERDRRALELAASLSQAKLQALRLQLQPHFLFNTLNAIATLVHTNPEAADEMITNLSEMLRLSLEVTAQEVPLRQEFDLLERYLEIEQVRLGERLNVVREVDPALLPALVPALMIQTLVENAIRHGIEPRRSPGSVTVRAVREGDTVRLTIADDGVGLQPAERRDGRRGIGLANTEDRLRELYGPAASVNLQAPPEGGVRVEIRLPWHVTPVHAGGSLPS